MARGPGYPDRQGIFFQWIRRYGESATGRGKDGCLAATVWEIHPVTSITLLKSDGTPHKSSDRFTPKKHRQPLGAPHSKPNA